MASWQTPLSSAMDRSCDLSLPNIHPYPAEHHRVRVSAENQRDMYTVLQIWGIYPVDDRHGEQSQKFSIAVNFYTVLSVTRDRLQMFDDLVALVYEQTRSSEPLAMRRSLSIKI